ncbi:MAG TPA: hypothetical protein VE132_00245 [Micromonosporaceae bacterium]|nr:hypothetical protein [Micromonosporaceae bacterium]
MSPLDATHSAASCAAFDARMCGDGEGMSAPAMSVVLPMLTKRRPVDFCLVAASLCRCC